MEDSGLQGEGKRSDCGERRGYHGYLAYIDTALDTVGLGSWEVVEWITMFGAIW